jgi:hypothetical protein
MNEENENGERKKGSVNLPRKKKTKAIGERRK